MHNSSQDFSSPPLDVNRSIEQLKSLNANLQSATCLLQAERDQLASQLKEANKKYERAHNYLLMLIRKLEVSNSQIRRLRKMINSAKAMGKNATDSNAELNRITYTRMGILCSRLLLLKTHK